MTTSKVRALTRTQAKGNSTTKICSLCTLLLIKTSSLLTLKSTVVEYSVEKLTKVERQSLKRGREEGEKRDFIMNGTRESAILKSGIREIVTLTNREPRWPLTRIYEEIDPLSHEKRQVRNLLSIQEVVGPLSDTLQ